MDPDAFHVNLLRHADRVVVHVRGEIDLLTAPRLRATLLEACQAPATDVFVDLTSVAFFDAQALDELAAAAGRLRAAGCRLVVHGLSDWQAGLVRLCGLEDALSIDYFGAGERALTGQSA
jgi:anti-sigma B factor antagonist